MGDGMVWPWLWLAPADALPCLSAAAAAAAAALSLDSSRRSCARLRMRRAWASARARSTEVPAPSDGNRLSFLLPPLEEYPPPLHTLGDGCCCCCCYWVVLPVALPAPLEAEIRPPFTPGAASLCVGYVGTYGCSSPWLMARRRLRKLLASALPAESVCSSVSEETFRSGLRGLSCRLYILRTTVRM